jgi:outer membrane protein OmpA-like peptidoglycan-associated protein
MYSFYQKSWLLIALTMPIGLAQAQKEPTIYFANPSFEGSPQKGAEGIFNMPEWHDCGPARESSPDIQPGFFGVMLLPKHGNSYISLVVRAAETWESVGQRLSKPLEKGNCYEFSLDLARSDAMSSKVSAADGSPFVPFVTPAKLIIWGGNGYCQKGEVLWETSTIINTRWLTYNFRLQPKSNWTYIMFEAYYQTPVLFPYNGNVLIDNASSIKKVACNPEPMPAMVAKPKPKPEEKPKEPVAKVEQPKGPPPAPESLHKPVAKNIKKGKVYRLDKVYFDTDKYVLKPESDSQLEELFNLLRNNPSIVVEICGHTNNKLWPDEEKAKELSTNRAKSVVDWLTHKGIGSSRLKYSGLGWKEPIEPNTTDIGRKKNQRVEVKILDFNG